MAWVKTVQRKGQSTLVNSIYYNGSATDRYQQALGIPFGLDLQLNAEGEIFLDADEWDALKKGVRLLMEEKGVEWLESCLGKLEKKGKELLGYAERINATDFRGAKTEALESAFSGFVERALELGPALYFPLAAEPTVQQKLVQKIRAELLQKRQADRADSVLLAVCKPTRRTEVEWELINFYLIAAEIQENGLAKAFAEKGIPALAKHPVLVRLVRKHAEEFGWIGIRWGTGKEWTAGDVAARLADAVADDDCENKYFELKQAAQKTAEETERLFDELNFPQADRRLALAAKKLAHFRTWRTSTYGKSVWLIKPLLSQIMRLSGLEWADSPFMTYTEILSIARGGKMEKKEIVERRRANTYFYDHGNETVFSGAGMEKARKMVSQTIESTEVKGTPASYGTARGTVRIVLDPAVHSGFNKGDILVAPMTNPNFVPLMHRAAAIVTDEGGILCHAAIVSREFGKPCIIGTKNATKVLKDGELVFVDATAGIVERLEKKKE